GEAHLPLYPSFGGALSSCSLSTRPSRRPFSRGETMSYRIALIPGDGIGKEVIPEGVRVLRQLAGGFNFTLEFEEFPYSCQHYLEHGAMMPADGIQRLSAFDAIFLGAVGAPGV